MDKNRMLVIILTRLLKRLLDKINDSLNPQDSPYNYYLKVFYSIAVEYLMWPVIHASEQQKIKGQHLSSLPLNTPSLEYLFCMI